MKNYTSFLLIIFSISKSLFAQGVDPTSTSPEIRGFALQSNQLGNASNSVNLFTGDVSLPINLVSLSGRNGLNVNVSINYNSSVSNAVSTWNLEAPTGILGLGWSIDFPKVVCDNKSTGTREDDEYYLVEGGSSNRLIRTKSGSNGSGSFYEYETKNYQFWKVKYFYDRTETIGPGYGSGSNKWEITREDGTRYVYGDKNSGRKTIQYVVRWDNWIGNSSQITGQSQLANTWNLSEIISTWGDKVVFEYDNIEQFVGSASGQKQTEASYLKQITDVIGRKVQFFYNIKQSQYYTEPHTEKVEPDAYQEFYETKYLDHIDVLEESGSKYLTMQLEYGVLNDGTNLAKMLLTSVEQRNANSNTLPKLKFDYVLSGPTKGYLQSVVYPTGGKVIYEYSAKQIGHSFRDLEIKAPTGFAESKIWMGDDYVVVAWRAMGSAFTHDSAPKTVKLYVYQWVGEWKEQFLQTISGVSMPYYTGGGSGGTFFMEYDNFQVVTEANFFSVLRKSSGNNHICGIYYKNESQRGAWSTLTKNIDVGDGTPRLLSGNHFIAVAPFRDDSTHPCNLFTYNGNSWTESFINQTIGDHYYTSTNNYFISQNRAGFDGAPDFSFSYLSETRKWTTKNWNSWLEYSSDDPSRWYASNGMALAMADNNPEYAYRWDLTYTNFFRDEKDILNSDLFGSLDDASPVSIINNSFIGIKGRLARFDGKYWYSNTITSTSNSPFGFYYAYGEDVAVRPTQFLNITLGYKGARKTFDPNTLQWLADVDITSTSWQEDFAYVGLDHYYYGNSYFYRQPDGQWIKKSTTTNGYKRSQGGYPRYEIWNDIFPYADSYVTSFKNGESNSFYISNYNSMSGGYLLKSKGEGNYSFVLYSKPSVDYGDVDPKTYATKLKLFRQVNDDIQGKQLDYPVTLLTVLAGDKAQYTSFDYNLATAVMDINGTTAHYNEVTVIPGSTSVINRPNGYTKTFYNNGLSMSELYNASAVTDLHWLGASYESQVYDASNNVVSYSKTSYTTYLKNLLNDVGVKVQVGAYVRPTQGIQMADGISSTTNNIYDANTGLLTQSSMTGPISVQITNKYFWEIYDPSRTLNILTPVVLSKRMVNGQYTEASAARFKNWTSANSPAGVYAPFDQYQWKKSGSVDFSTWDISLSPAVSDWRQTGKVSSRESITGIANEFINANGSVNSLFLDGNKLNVIAQCNNAMLSDIAFTSFEDAYKGTFNWPDAVGLITAGLSKSGFKFMNLDLTGVTKSGLNSGQTYKISFWAKSSGGSGIIDGVGTVDLSALEWKLFEYSVTGLTSINIKRTGANAVQIDEVRIHPATAFMTSFTYSSIYGLVSQTDSNNQSQYRDFDEWGRVKTLMDDDRNITQTFFFNFKN